VSARRPLGAPLLAVAVLAAACASIRPPVLYPNAHLKQVGKAPADRDVEDCRDLAHDHVESSAGKDIARDAALGGAGGAAVGGVAGAVSGGGAGRGAAIGAATGGAAGAVRGAARETEPSGVYKQFVSRCLRERGYDVIGWQ
jgi:outer membrane lipoprotein SlyB